MQMNAHVELLYHAGYDHQYLKNMYTQNNMLYMHLFFLYNI